MIRIPVPEAARRLLALILILVTILSPLSITQAQAAGPETAASVKEQIRAYARSINQSRADENAATDLALHGIRGKGKTLTMGPSSPLAATLVNSEIFQNGFAIIFADIINTMQRLDLESLPGVSLSFGWYGASSTYGGYILTDTGEYPDNLDWAVTAETYTGTRNASDDSLEWMVGGCEGSATIECIRNSGTEKTYSVTITFEDRFDFSTANSAGFKKILSAIGMRLFREFDWTCTVSTELTVPYSYDHCGHSSGAYRWSYDPQDQAMVSDGSGVYTLNNAAHHTATTKAGTVNHYYELEHTIRLEHNKPWVLEYDVCTPGNIVLAPVSNAVTKTHPQITQSARTSLYAVSKDYAMAPGDDGTPDRYYAYNYFGTKLTDLYPFAYQTTYTFRLENEVLPSGGNKIYLTAIETDTGKLCLDRVPMDDHDYYGGWMDKAEHISDESNWLSGRDIHINYIGTQITDFRAESFELRIWENGRDQEDQTHWTASTHAPTCTETGYTLRACRKCGMTERVNELPALGHRYESRITPPTCTEAGYTTHFCICGSTYTDGHQEATGQHIYENGICIHCRTAQPGDTNSDGMINALDLIILRQHLAGWDVVISNAADVNGDGQCNALDLILLRQYLAGWNVTLG